MLKRLIRLDQDILTRKEKMETRSKREPMPTDRFLLTERPANSRLLGGPRREGDRRRHSQGKKGVSVKTSGQVHTCYTNRVVVCFFFYLKMLY